MSLDLDCVRDILMTIEQEDMGGKWIFYNEEKLTGKYGVKEVIHHIKLCRNVEFVDGAEIYFGKHAVVGPLTESGRGLLEKIKNDDMWERLKTRFGGLM